MPNMTKKTGTYFSPSRQIVQEALLDAIRDRQAMAECLSDCTDPDSLAHLREVKRCIYDYQLMLYRRYGNHYPHPGKRPV